MVAAPRTLARRAGGCRGVSPPGPPTVHVAAFEELDASTLYALLRLRIDVFVVEQSCPYPELDGRDVEPAARHWWVDEGGGPVCYLRVLGEADGSTRIGRVVTRPDARGRGLAAHLIRRALDGDDCPRPVHVAAQAHLAAWYTRLGFRAAGPVYDEDGIPHVPMVLT